MGLRSSDDVLIHSADTSRRKVSAANSETDENGAYNIQHAVARYRMWSAIEKCCSHCCS